MQKLLIDMPIGENLKHLRCAAGLTQKDIVAKMQILDSNISRTSYVKIENGYHNIKVSDLVILKKILNVAYDEFFAGFVDLLQEHA